MALRMDISTVALVVERERGVGHTATPTTRQRQARRQRMLNNRQAFDAIVNE